MIQKDASIAGVGFRQADKLVGTEWVRTCLDFLRAGDIFRFVNQKGVVENDKVFRIVEPLQMAAVRNIGNPDPRATRPSYLGGEMKIEEVDKKEISC